MGSFTLLLTVMDKIVQHAGSRGKSYAEEEEEEEEEEGEEEDGKHGAEAEAEDGEDEDGDAFCVLRATDQAKETIAIYARAFVNPVINRMTNSHPRGVPAVMWESAKRMLRRNSELATRLSGVLCVVRVAAYAIIQYKNDVCSDQRLTCTRLMDAQMTAFMQDNIDEYVTMLKISEEDAGAAVNLASFAMNTALAFCTHSSTEELVRRMHVEVAPPGDLRSSSLDMPDPELVAVQSMTSKASGVGPKDFKSIVVAYALGQESAKTKGEYVGLSWACSLVVKDPSTTHKSALRATAKTLKKPKPPVLNLAAAKSVCTVLEALGFGQLGTFKNSKKVYWKRAPPDMVDYSRLMLLAGLILSEKTLKIRYTTNYNGTNPAVLPTGDFMPSASTEGGKGDEAGGTSDVGGSGGSGGGGGGGGGGDSSPGSTVAAEVFCYMSHGVECSSLNSMHLYRFGPEVFCHMSHGVECSSLNSIHLYRFDPALREKAQSQLVGSAGTISSSRAMEAHLAWREWTSQTRLMMEQSHPRLRYRRQRRGLMSI